MLYRIILYKEYRYYIMSYCSIKVLPYTVDMVDTTSVNHMFNMPHFYLT